MISSQDSTEVTDSEIAFNPSVTDRNNSDLWEGIQIILQEPFRGNFQKLLMWILHFEAKNIVHVSSSTTSTATADTSSSADRWVMKIYI